MYHSARDTLPHSTRAVLASGASAALVQFRKYVFYVFSGDWLYNALPDQDRDLTRKLFVARVAAGEVMTPGRHDGDFDATDQHLCRRFAERVGRFVLADIGSNYGHEGMRYAMLARDLGVPPTRYVAVEPGRAGLLLPANLVLHGFGEAQIVVAALAGRDGVDLLHFAQDATTAGTLSYNPRSTRDHTVPVALSTWDTIARDLELSGPTFFKIDIQGAERHFLDCAADYLEANTCAGVVEFLPSDFPSLRAAATFLRRFARDYYLFDAGIHRDRRVPITGAFRAFAETLKAQQKSWTDILFYPRSFGADFLN